MTQPQLFHQFIKAAVLTLITEHAFMYLIHKITDFYNVQELVEQFAADIKWSSPNHRSYRKLPYENIKF